MTATQITALIIFVFTYIGIIFNRLPLLNLDRKTSAYAGSVLMILCGVTDFDTAIQSIDFNTIVLLLGMMIIISVLKLDGFFTLISQKTLSSATTVSKLLVLIVFITGIASAFLVNDAVVLLFTPVIIQICKKINLNPMPFLLGEIFASNCGSLMAITGNPQNMLIGMASDIPYGEFMLYMLPISIVSMLVIVWVVKKTNKDMFSASASLQITKDKHNTTEIKNMLPSLIIFALVLLGFFFGKIFSLPIPIIALIGSVLIIMFSKHKSKDIIEGVDFSLLLFFASLFIIVSSVKQSGVLDLIFNIALQPNVFSILIIFALSLVLSQLLSNVPYTVLVLPIFAAADDKIMWLSLACSSTLAGNMTVIGAMANIIVIEQAEKEGIVITGRKFMRPALIITFITYLIAFAYMSFMI